MSAPLHTVLVSVPHGAAAGNMLRTGAVPRVLDVRPDIRVVLVSPLVKDKDFVREFTHPRIVLEDLPPHRPGGWEGRLLAFVQAGYLGSGVTESVRIRRQEAIAKKTIRWIGTKRAVASVIAPSMLKPATRYRVMDRLVAHPAAEALFDRYAPVLLISSSPGLIFSEMPLLRTAVRRGVRSMAIDPSWDNFTNKLLPARRVSRLIVWNELMKQQAIEYHGYQAEEIRIAGTPQWDLYFRSGGASRDEFFTRIGADPSRRLVTLTTTPRELYPHHDHVLRVMIEALNAGAWGDAQILVRLHPRDEVEPYAEFQGAPHVIIEKPFRATVRAGDGLAIDMTAASQQHLMDTMRHSDVVVNVASTLAIEAAIFDTPVVNISFDGEAPSEWARSARRYYRFTHYVNITRQQAVRVAEQPADLARFVAQYLDDPSLDRDGRRRMVLEQCQYLDGRAAERVTGFVVDELNDVIGDAEPAVRQSSDPRGAVARRA